MTSQQVKSLKSPTGSFKSPIQGKSKESVSSETLQQDIDLLSIQSKQLDKEITALQTQGLKVEELDEHINKLHEYNEMKDIGQMILGRIATLKGVRSQDLYNEYSLNLED